MGLTEVQENDLEEMGRKRGFQRRQDETSNTISMIRNKKTGVGRPN